MSKTYKYLIPEYLRDVEQVERLKSRLKRVLPKDSKVIICEGGTDIKPVHQEYYGLKYKDEQWIMNKDGSVAWYPCEEIAEIAKNQLSASGVEVRSFNGIDEIKKEWDKVSQTLVKSEDK